MTYTDKVTVLTAEIKKVRSGYYESSITDYEYNYRKLQELNHELWALNRGYCKFNSNKDPHYNAFLLVVYQWCVTVTMVVYGGGL